MGTDPAQAHVAVLGATGSIGQVCAKLLAEEVAAVTLIGRNEAKTRDLATTLQGRAAVKVTTDAAAGLRDADIVITVTLAVDTVVPVEALKRGAVVCDVARPRCLSQSRQGAPRRAGDRWRRGRGPRDVDFNFNFGFPPKTAYACMSQTMTARPRRPLRKLHPRQRPVPRAGRGITRLAENTASSSPASAASSAR